MESVIAANIRKIKDELPEHVTLVAVSKTKPVSAILDAYNAGQRHFGENKVQEWQQKQPLLPQDIYWHLIGHLQTNKVKYVVGKVHLIHGVDSLKLLSEINRQATKLNTVQDCLLQIHIAKEETKFGLNIEELHELIGACSQGGMQHVRIRGLMGMATYTENKEMIADEFKLLNQIFESIKSQNQFDAFDTLSMGMSNDYQIAIACGSNMVRIGSGVFGTRI